MNQHSLLPREHQTTRIEKYIHVHFHFLHLQLIFNFLCKVKRAFGHTDMMILLASITYTLKFFYRSKANEATSLIFLMRDQAMAVLCKEGIHCPSMVTEK